MEGMIQLTSYKQEDSDEDKQDLCRICRSPEKPGNALRCPCACRGSMKHVHENCINHWLLHSKHKQCEVCGSSYSFVTVYSENAPKRLSCIEFLKGMLLRVLPYAMILGPWVTAFFLNTCCVRLLLSGLEITDDQQMGPVMSWISDSLLLGVPYNYWIAYYIDWYSRVRIPLQERIAERFPGGFRAEIFIENVLGHGVVARVACLLWKYKRIVCDWCHSCMRNLLGEFPRVVHGFGLDGLLLSFLDENAFTALKVSIYMSFLFVLMPFGIGRSVLATVGNYYFFDKSPVILGYMVMLSVSLACLGNYFALHPDLFPAIVRWFSLGFNFITVKLPCLMWVYVKLVCGLINFRAGA